MANSPGYVFPTIYTADVNALIQDRSRERSFLDILNDLFKSKANPSANANALRIANTPFDIGNLYTDENVNGNFFFISFFYVTTNKYFS